MQPTRLSPGEFMWAVRREVEEHSARLVVIDSLNSYFTTMPEEQALLLQMHELLKYLDSRGVTTLLILAQHGLVGEVRAPFDLSFLSDTIVLLRFFEAGGEVRKAISVVKKRSSMHEFSVREYRTLVRGRAGRSRTARIPGCADRHPLLYRNCCAAAARCAAWALIPLASSRNAF